MTYKNILLLPILLFFHAIAIPKAGISYTQIDENSKKITIFVPVEKEDFVYKDYIEVSVDNPNIELLSWQIDQQPIKHFSKEFRETKNIFNKDFTVTLHTAKKGEGTIEDAHIHLSYYLHSKKGIIEELFPYEKKERCSCCCSCVHTNIDAAQQDVESLKTKRKTNTKNESWTDYISGLVQTSQSTWIRILLAFLLGVLLSLTPCIYPMIPITVGILQAQGSKSVFYNFLLSTTYTVGISTTFAILGLIAAFTGQLFGSLLINPFFVAALIAILVYLALSLFGFYEIYIPRFMQPKDGTPQKSSLISILIFGLASGAVASPCVSPGLILLLSIVTAIGNKFLGFLLLFSFGIGMGLPLIIIGTFSGSMALFPKAGVWMVEIKKLFGVMLFGVCFYFLANIAPTHITLWSIAIFMLFIGLYYLLSIKPFDTKLWKIFKNFVGIGCCALSIFVGFKAYKETYMSTKIKKEDRFWLTNYQKATELAKKTNKKLFIDFYANWCTLCKSIDKKMFQDKTVRKALEEKFVNLKVDGTNPSNEPFATLHKKYKIIGFPTFLLVDPETKKIIIQWSSELDAISNKEFIGEIKGL